MVRGAPTRHSLVGFLPERRRDSLFFTNTVNEQKARSCGDGDSKSARSGTFASVRVWATASFPRFYWRSRRGERGIPFAQRLVLAVVTFATALRLGLLMMTPFVFDWR